MNLRTKFLLAFVLVALLGVGTVALVANRVIDREFTLYVRTGGQPRSQRLADQAAEIYAQSNTWSGTADELAARLSATVPGSGPGGGRGQGAVHQEQGSGTDRVLVIDQDGQVVVDTEGDLTGQPMPGDYATIGVAIAVGEMRVGTLLLTTKDLSGRSDLERRFLDTVNQAVLWAVLLVAVAAVVAAAILSRQLVGPLRALTAASEAMAGGDMSQRVEIDRADEIGDLGRAFDRMASDLAAASKQRQQMTADIAHELRNPLSVIRGNLEAMLDGIYPADDEHLGPIYEETLLLQRLVQDLRLLSLADAGELRLVRSEVDLGALLSAIVESVQAVADDQGVELALDLPEGPVVVWGDVDRLRQIVGNLLGNALRYTPQGGAILLRASSSAGRVAVSVADTGPGISPADLPHIFDRLYRADSARDRASGGSGLGLAIVRALVEAHGGEIGVESTPGQGTTFTVTLPASR